MRVQVSGRHVDVGDALRTRIDEELTGSIGRYFERGGDAEVVVGRDGHAFKVDCAVTLATGQHLHSQGTGGEAHGAFTQALAKIETRIRRYKQRLKSHAVAASAKAAETASLYVLSGDALRGDEAMDGAGDGAKDQDWDDEDWRVGEGGLPPAAMVIAETEAPLKTMTVSMAVMDLDLTESQAIVFRNAAHGGLSVVYRRSDGNIGWVDPERTRRSV
jgi:ribosomal subunit interface protein